MNLDTRIRSALSREADSVETPWPRPWRTSAPVVRPERGGAGSTPSW